MPPASDPRPGVVFDVDGTLCDTVYMHTLAWWQAFRSIGVHVPAVRLHGLIGMGSDKLTEEICGEEREDLKERWQEAFEPFRSQLVAFEGAGDLLREIAARGGVVALASSSTPEDFAALREAIGADEVITAGTSSGDAEESKPSPDIVSVALEKAGLDPSRALFVGDTIWDVKAAGAAGLRTVGVLSGGIPRSDLEEAGAIAVYRDPADLLANLDDSPIGELLRG